MAGSKKINKAKAREIVVLSYEVLAGMDGNPNSPAEFDASPHDDDELYFKADADATEAEKTKVLMLNFIHKELHHTTLRKVPILNAKSDNPGIEVYHRVEFRGVSMDVCVFWPARDEGEFKQCVALVKLTSDDLSSSDTPVIDGDAAWNAGAMADKFTLKNDKLKANYWAPRWKYVVNTLRTLAYDGYEKNGTKKPEPEVLPGENSDGDNGVDNSEETEELMSVFAGCTGKIIGPKGAKIQEIKRLSGVKDIKMPPKDEDAPRPRARDPAEITIIGKVRAIAKAKELIQEVVDEWANAPRPPRNGGFQAQTTQPDRSGADTFGGVEEAPAMIGDWGGNSGGGGADTGVGSGEWADSGADAGGW